MSSALFRSRADGDYRILGGIFRTVFMHGDCPKYYVINLEGKSRDFDVLSIDVIWVPEFARAGWLMDVNRLLGPGEERAFFPGPMLAVTMNNRIYAIPWYIDAGVLYYRKDLLNEVGGIPERFGTPLETFHGQNIEREKTGRMRSCNV